MSSDANRKVPWYKSPMFWGVAGTVVLFAVYALLAFVVDCDPTGLVCHSKWAQFVSASPNEIGDTLAGLAGALAFLWIVVTVMLQSQELREQRAEMKLQREEFEKMVEAQEAQVKALQAQAAIFEDEKRARDEMHADRLFDAKLSHIQLLYLSYKAEGVESPTASPSDKRTFYGNIPDAENLDVFITMLSKFIKTFRRKDFPWECDPFDHSAFGLNDFGQLEREICSKTIELAKECSQIEGRLSEPQKQRYRSLGIDILSGIQDDFMNSPQSEVPPL